jgi:hypothetical protein
MTELQIIAIYCFCDDFLKNKGHKDWPNVKMGLAEIMLVYIVATRFFYGNIERAYATLKDGKYISRPVVKGQLNERLHAVDPKVWHELIRFAYEKAQTTHLSRDFIIDSFPVSVCRNIRISRCRIYQNEEFRGFNASKKEYFYGLKVNMVATAEGQPFEASLSPGKYHDSDPFKLMDLQLPLNSSLYGDSAYTDYEYEDKLKERGIRVIIERKENSTRHHYYEDWKDLKFFRRKIETTFSRITAFLPRKIHAVTDAGFELKVMGFIIALSLNFIIS